MITGKLLDGDYKEMVVREASADPENPVSAEQVTRDEIFPLARARMRKIPLHLIVCAAGCVGYGWCLEKEVSMGTPLVL